MNVLACTPFTAWDVEQPVVAIPDAALFEEGAEQLKHVKAKDDWPYKWHTNRFQELCRLSPVYAEVHDVWPAYAEMALVHEDFNNYTLLAVKVSRGRNAPATFSIGAAIG